MRRFARNSLGIALGLTLGWLAAGWFGQQSSTFADAQAPATATPAYDGHAAPAEGHAHDSHDHAAHDAHGHTDAHGHGGHDNPATLLAPHDVQHDAPFLRPVLTGVLALFVGAVVIGLPALKFRGPEPPDPAAAHDDHGHDNHAHDHKH